MNAMGYMRGVFAKRPKREAPEGSSAWLDRTETPFNRKMAGSDPPPMINIYGQLAMPMPGPRGRGRKELLMKDIVRDDDAGDPRLPDQRDTEKN